MHVVTPLSSVRKVQDCAKWVECSLFKPSGWNAFNPISFTRLKVGIRVCNKIALHCTVIFDAGDIAFPPDLIVHEFNVRLLDIKYLIEWDAQDESNLLYVFSDVRQQFIKYQLEQFMSSNVERLVFEIGCIAHVEDLELLVETNSTSLRKEYHVYVPVCYHETLADLDLNDPPKRAVLYVKYDMNQDNSAVNTITREFLSLKTMKPDTTIKLPSCDKDTLIVDYLAQIQDLLQKTQSIRLNNHAARERLVQCLVTEFAEYVLEYDDVDFSYVGLYINAYATNETKQTCEVVAGAVVNVHISALYPLEPIVIILSSPTKFQSSDSYIPESREWKLPFTRDMQPEDTVLAIKANVIEQIMRWFSVTQ